MKRKIFNVLFALGLLLGVSLVMAGPMATPAQVAANPGPAYPVIEGTATYTTDSTIASHSVNLPTGIQSGNLLIMIFRAGSAVTVSSGPSGWTLLGSRNSNGVTYVWYKTADGTEGSTVTVTTGSSIHAAAISYRISGWGGTPEIAFAGSNVNDPPSLSPSWGSAETLWIAVMTNRRSDSSVSAAPTSYTGLITISQASNIGTDRSRVSSAHRFLTAASEDPGAFTTSGTIDNPHSATIAVKPYSPVVITTTGSGTFTVPALVTQITVEAWGVGGAGGGRTSDGRAGGGGGGAYAKKTFSGLTPGSSISYYVAPTTTGGTSNGANGAASWFSSNDANGVVAAGGSGGTSSGGTYGGTGGAGGSTTNSYGDVKYAGGDGGTATSSYSGGGGVAAPAQVELVEMPMGGQQARAQRILAALAVPAEPELKVPAIPDLSMAEEAVERTGLDFPV